MSEYVKRIIFHQPLPLDTQSASASAIRPFRMLEAFREAGYSVDVVSGSARERRSTVALLREKFSRGWTYDFLYSESSTLPTLLTDSSRIPSWPSVDFSLFRLCKERDVPIGLFYRDIYWIFPAFRKRLGRIKFKISEAFYRYDLVQYEKLVDKVYLPSMEMSKYVPTISAEKFDALPPGHAYNADSPRLDDKSEGLRILYVGGMGIHYEMQELFRAVKNIRNVKLTICTREKDWLSARSSYPYPLPENIRIVHVSGNQLESLYACADIAALCIRPHEYWEFAAPFKLFEYIGHRMPVIASEGTLSGRFVTERNVGWAVPYNQDEISTLLKKISSDSSLLVRKRREVDALAPGHTWLARVNKVVEDMRQLREKKKISDEQMMGNLP